MIFNTEGAKLYIKNLKFHISDTRNMIILMKHGKM